MGPRALASLVAALSVAIAGAACGGAASPGPAQPHATPVPPSALSGQVWTEGSTDLTGLLILASERFRRAHSGVEVVVGLSGEVRGVQRLCRGEVDIAVVHNPIPAEQMVACTAHGVELVRIGSPADQLFVYSRTVALQRPAVRAFAEYVASGDTADLEVPSPDLHKKKA